MTDSFSLLSRKSSRSDMVMPLSSHCHKHILAVKRRERDKGRHSLFTEGISWKSNSRFLFIYSWSEPLRLDLSAQGAGRWSYTHTPFRVRGSVTKGREQADGRRTDMDGELDPASASFFGNAITSSYPKESESHRDAPRFKIFGLWVFCS